MAEGVVIIINLPAEGPTTLDDQAIMAINLSYQFYTLFQKSQTGEKKDKPPQVLR